MCRLAKLRAGDVVLDPMCGAGTLLVMAAGSADPAAVVGCDISQRAVRDAAANLARRGIAGTVLQADAGRLPLQAGTVDRVLTNLVRAGRSHTTLSCTHECPRADPGVTRQGSCSPRTRRCSGRLCSARRPAHQARAALKAVACTNCICP
jgi:tRNA/tmRNA/rRNA uracil-C5-methylase (TrmA/RlmC/RlmD family)